MKQTNILISIAVMASTIITAACTEEECSPEALTITGTIELPVTRTALDGPDANGVYKTVWKEGDAIAIFSEEHSNNFTEHKLLSGAGTNVGIFSAAGITSNKVLAVYPSSIAISRNYTIAVVNLPETQRYVEGNIPENAYPMYTWPSNGTLKFKNMGSILKIPMYGDLIVKSITFTPNNPNIRTSGKAVLDGNSIRMLLGSYPSVKLDCEDGVKLTDVTKDFHIVVPAQNYPEGFTIAISTNKGAVVKIFRSTIELDRSVLYPIEAFECKVIKNQDYIDFDDACFKAYLIADHDQNKDGEISYEEALAVRKITVNTDQITSLKGIEFFTNLESLTCTGSHVWLDTGGYDNKGTLTKVDLSKNVKLKELNCSYNKIESIDISNNTELESLALEYCQLTSLDVRNNPKLRYLTIECNQLNTIDVSNNSLLQTLICGENNLTALDVSNNQCLVKLRCSVNKIAELDLSNNSLLEILYCFSNNFENLDISKIIGLKELYCRCAPCVLKRIYVLKGQYEAINVKSVPEWVQIIVKDDEKPEEWVGKEFWHRSLAMRFTATWCGYCPNLATGFAKAVSQYPNKIEQLNLHPASSNLGFSGTSALSNIFNVTGYPTGMIDYRSRIGNYASDDAATLVVDAVKETEKYYPVKTGTSFSSSVSGNTLNLNIKLYIKEKGDYKVTAVLLEDNIIGYQNGGGSSYNHSSIARVAITDITGDAVSTSEDNKTVSKNYTATIPSSCDKNNLRVLVYVLKQYGSQTIIRTADYGDYYVDNAVSAAVGTTQDLVFSDGTVYGGNEDTKDGGEITLK